MHCTVIDIRGDYAVVKYDTTGVESEVAIALLPMGVDVGDRLVFENYEFPRCKNQQNSCLFFCVPAACFLPESLLE